MKFMNVAAYARYSTDHQDENSIETQFENIHEYCQNHQYNIVAHYFDKAKSGTNIERADFQEMITAAKSGNFAAIVIYDITRGSRDVADWFTFRKEMMHAGVQIISTHDNIGDLLNPNDFLTELIGVGIGQHHVLTTRTKTIDGITKRAQEGVFLGGCPPLGYDVEDGNYIINEQEARIVKKIFHMYAAGKSYNSIIDALSGAVGKKGRPLGKNSLHSILRNDRYIGVYTWNRKNVKMMGKWAGGTPNQNMVRIPDAIPRIIDQVTWDAVQVRMNSRKNAASKAKRTYLLSGKISCCTCGATYCGHTSTGRGYSNSYYICGNRTRTKSCQSKSIRSLELEEFCRSSVRNYLLNIDHYIIAQKIAAAYEKLNSDFSSEKKELISISSKIKNGTEAILNGFSSQELFRQMQDLQTRKATLEKILLDDKSTPLSVDAVAQMIKGMISDINYNIDEVVKKFVIKINAQENGNCTISLGVVHTKSCGDRI